MTLSTCDRAIAAALKDANPDWVANRIPFTVDAATGCHIAQTATTSKGYARISLPLDGARIAVKAHRFAFAAAYGMDALPPGILTNADSGTVDHACQNETCINAAHLRVLSVSENTKAAAAARRAATEMAVAA